MGKVVLNQPVINRLGSWGPIDDDMKARARNTQSIARARGLKDTGDYVRSIDIEPLQPHGWRTIARDHKSAWLEDGTPPHIIRPRTKQALWYPGAPHPMALVHHPGTRATNNMAEALELGARGTTHT